jgi:glycosyltransferase involved in cell wall biosynthesis
VSVVTPVHNGETYLPECIESVLAQTYQNWEYIISNNCSTDRTLQIAEQYRARDARIRIHNTETLISGVENHNFALSKIDPGSQYCKILHADDWLFPDCLEEMTELAVAHPSVGIVGAYSLVDTRVECDGLSFPSTVVPGRELARLSLLGRAYPFSSPSSTMIRADLVRQRNPFYPLVGLHADVEVMYQMLQHCDFGFVHQVLSYVRTHSQSESSTKAGPLNTMIWANFDMFLRHGPIFLKEQEFLERRRWHLKGYYRFLADSFFEGRGGQFWRYHRRSLASSGYPMSLIRLLGSIARAIVSRPKTVGRNVLRAIGLR